ncbi:MAG: tetratricopeptide repeat protein [Acidobacteriota bacterium]
MTFAAPFWLWALLAVPALLAVELWATRRDRERVSRLVARPLWARVVRRPREHWRWITLALVLVGTAALVVALARPQWGIVREKVEREGVDVVLLLDASGSMACEDVPPSRFFLARAALTALIERLPGDRFALVAFEGEAYPLVPLTLDADAIGLFLETVEPGIVPAPGTSIGAGLSRSLELFVDAARSNQVMVVVSDGEDLEGEVEAAIARAKAAGVVVHAVGVGTGKGAPVPDFDREGRPAGFKKDEDGAVVVSRLHEETLQAIAQATGGQYLRLGADGSLVQLASAIDAMEQKTLAREFSYQKKERYQLPLGVALLAFTFALLLPLPGFRKRGPAMSSPAAKRRPTMPVALVALAAVLTGQAPPALAEGPEVANELLLRPQRHTASGRRHYAAGDHPKALESFEKAAAARPADRRTRLNLADALYKNGKYEEAAAIFRALGADPTSPLAAAARFNLGDTLFQQQDYEGAARAFREALALQAEDLDTRRNLELALRALAEQKKQQEQQEPKDQEQQGLRDEKNQQPKPQPRPQSVEEKEKERFQRETGMPKERAMQLLEALQQNEKEEQKRLLAARRAERKKGKDW